ncbi:hypothetical protein EX30DRAFT_363234 [Ascodesmis nigricans]|uniref:Uncharacterized protein n=1 Tax=Ascodesmis nigricans TaxID=341454 RepID=A0A4S2MZA1_9PEZI|nr:hypothetical protein EX30DRAFT_363234 [Ascodesmis nigricans]
MLRLHPTAIILSHDEIQKELKERSPKSNTVPEHVPTTWDYTTSLHDTRDKGKQPAIVSSSPTMLSGHHAIVAALQGLSLGASNSIDDLNAGYISGSERSLPHDGGLDVSSDFFPTPAAITDSFDGEGGSETATATASMTTTTVPATPGGSGAGRVQRWISRTPVDGELFGRHGNLNWNLEDYDEEWQYESDNVLEDIEYLPDDEDDAAGIVQTEDERRGGDPLLRAPTDAFRTLAHRQLDGVAEMDGDDDDGDNVMIETPRRSGIASPNSEYGPRTRSPANWANNTDHRDFARDVFAYLHGSPSRQMPLTEGSVGLDLGRGSSSAFQPSPMGPDIFAFANVAHSIHRYFSESSRRRFRIHDPTTPVDPEEYSEDSDEEISPEQLAILEERKRRMQMEAARRIIR